MVVGCREIWGLGFRVYQGDFLTLASGLRVQELGFGVYGLVFRREMFLLSHYSRPAPYRCSVFIYM